MKARRMRTTGAFRSFDDLPDVSLVRIEVVAALYACDPRTIRNRVSRGDMPAPEKRGGLLTWRVGDIKRDLLSISEQIIEEPNAQL